MIFNSLTTNCSLDIALKISRQQDDLVTACINGNRVAQKQLYESMYGRMMGICLRYSRDEDEARSLVNQGFFKVFKSLSKKSPSAPLEAWMKRIMINTSIDEVRKRNRRKTEELSVVSDYVVDENIISQFQVDEILKLVQQLPEMYRTVFNLSVIEGYNHKEIAEMLNIEEATSRSNLSKSKKKLREFITQKLRP